MQRQRSTRGFTILEILVALAIIFVLTGIVVGALSGSREKARDTRRLTDLDQIQVALRLYAEANGEYPCEDHTACNAAAQSADANGQLGTGGTIDTLLAPYLPNVPQDPRHDGSTYFYYYDGRVDCGGSADEVVIYARTAESVPYQTGGSSGCAGDAGAADAYTVEIARSSDTY